MKVEKTKRIILELTLDDFIVLRGALNKYQIDRHRVAEKLQDDPDSRTTIFKESIIAKNLFDAVDRQWNDYEV